MSADRPLILIIDDNPENLRVAVDLLQAYSFVVRTARDGTRGLRRARLNRPQLILLDIQMPGIDGYETCKRLKADPELADIPVVFMTALSAARDKVRAFEVGGVDYVTKPFEVNELVARVQTHLDLARLRAELTAQNRALQGQVSTQRAHLDAAEASRSAMDQERAQLIEMVRGQSHAMQQISRRWEQTRGGALADPGAALRSHLRERLRLVEGNLAQALALLPDGEGVEACRTHLELARSMLDPMLDEGALIEAPEASPFQQLSDREREVLRLVAAGKGTSEIAGALAVSVSTVSTYRRRIREKTGAESLLALVALHARS